MKNRLLIALLSLSILTTSCSQEEKAETQIAWDTWGVPHITANTIEELTVDG